MPSFSKEYEGFLMVKNDSFVVKEGRGDKPHKR
jgi:hypothetical protein